MSFPMLRCPNCHGKRRSHVKLSVVTLESGEECDKVQCRTCGRQWTDKENRWVPPGLKLSRNGLLKQLTFWD